MISCCRKQGCELQLFIDGDMNECLMRGGSTLEGSDPHCGRGALSVGPSKPPPRINQVCEGRRDSHALRLLPLLHTDLIGIDSVADSGEVGLRRCSRRDSAHSPAVRHEMKRIRTLRPQREAGRDGNPKLKHPELI
ncbi:Hypothetical predicted protein [Xyrichtys novacula]|uniref:Uncharacterized protein n=1 Tax=Xyrichtys novacula TaxID=13765 RepID=A0AAV1F3E8_XYRNO|nr:Hypothetical predicted protein [Xyrichtys novacula]